MGFCADFQAVECFLKQTNSHENTTEKVRFVAILSNFSANITQINSKTNGKHDNQIRHEEADG